MPLRILRLRGLVGSSVVRGFLVTGMFSTFFLGTLYLEHVLGYSALETGLAFLPMTLTVAVAVARASRRGWSPASARCACCIAGHGRGDRRARAAADHGRSAHELLPDDLLRVLPRSAWASARSFMPLLTIAMADVPQRDAGLGSGIINVSQQVAGALGLAVLGTIATEPLQRTRGARPVGSRARSSAATTSPSRSAPARSWSGIVVTLVVLRPLARRASSAVVSGTERPVRLVAGDPDAQLERAAA